VGNTCTNHFIFLHLITLVISGEAKKILNFFTMQFSPALSLSLSLLSLIKMFPQNRVANTFKQFSIIHSVYCARNQLHAQSACTKYNYKLFISITFLHISVINRCPPGDVHTLLLIYQFTYTILKQTGAIINIIIWKLWIV